MKNYPPKVVVNTGQAYVYVKDSADTVTCDAVRNAFSAKAGQQATGIGRLLTADEVRAMGGDPTAFLALEAAPSYQMGPGYTGDYVAPPIYRATHGYDPARPDMHASLLLFGPNVPHGTIAGARLVDIAPTIAGWLGLTMPNVDGKPLRITPAP